MFEICLRSLQLHSVGLSQHCCKYKRQKAMALRPTSADVTCRRSSGRSDNRQLSHNCSRSLSVGLFLLVIAGNAIVEGALRNVNLIIEPPAVRRGQHAIVRCLYDLDGAPLYSAKFYRGQLEFYRYTPGEFPNTKVFPFPGIHVDVTNSNATQVLIRNVGFGLSGNFSCEVTADAPLFSTATAAGIMQVVELPEKRPQLFTEHTRYEPGDVLRANCSTPPSRPRADLKFTINNMVVGNAEPQYIRTIDNLIASRISLKLQLQGIHFASANPSLPHGYGGGGGGVYGGGSIGAGHAMNSVHGPAGGGAGAGNGAGAGGGGVGSLVLRCTAQIGDLYQEYKEIELGTPQKDPVPARVTLSSGSSMTNFFSSYFSSASSRATPVGATLLLAIAVGVVGSRGSGRGSRNNYLAAAAVATELCNGTFAFFNQILTRTHKSSVNADAQAAHSRSSSSRRSQSRCRKQILQQKQKQKQRPTRSRRSLLMQANRNHSQLYGAAPAALTQR